MQKVICQLCKHFIGFISDDGKRGPLFDADDCQSDHMCDKQKCPMVGMLSKFQPYVPQHRPVGSAFTPHDDDENDGDGTYYTHGMTAEDQNT